MRRLVMAVVVTGIAAAVFAAWGLAAPAGSTTARTVDRERDKVAGASGGCGSAGGGSSASSAMHRRSDINVRGQNAGLDVEIALVLALRVRSRQPCHLRARTDAGPRAVAHDRSRRPRHLDVHVHDRPRHAHRLLPRVLQGQRAAPREERRPRSAAERHQRATSRDDQRLDIRPVGAPLFRIRSSSSPTPSRTRCSPSTRAGRTR